MTPRSTLGRLALVAAALALLLLGVVVGGAAGFRLREADVERRDGQVASLIAEVSRVNGELGARSERIIELLSDVSARDLELRDKDAEIGDLERQVAELDGLISNQAILQVTYIALSDDYKRLQGDFDGSQEALSTLQAAHDALQARLAELVPIDSFALTQDSLLFDQTGNASIIQPVCTGSMEPNIGCNDLLLVYQPVTMELDVGDVIVFRKQEADCSGSILGLFVLHRITAVLSTEDGIHFRTRGDANEVGDRCSVPASDVVSKVLAVIHDARLQE